MRKINSSIFIPTERELFRIFGLEAAPMEENLTGTVYKNIPVFITGIGKANAAFTAAVYFSRYSPEKAALIGICGAYENSGLTHGDIVSIKYDYFVDECVYDGKKITLLADKNMPPTPMNRSEFAVHPHFRQTDANTVSFIPAENSISRLYAEKTKAKVENMEGAAFGLSAGKLGAKTYHIRAVSNMCGAGYKTWDIEKAAENLRKAVEILFL